MQGLYRGLGVVSNSGLLQSPPEANQNTCLDTLQAGYLVLTIHARHFHMDLIEIDTQSPGNVSLHLRQAFFHTRLLTAENSHIHRSQKQAFWLDQTSPHLWQVF